MATINVYSRYFEGDAVHNGVKRNGVAVWLVSDSENGSIRYEVQVSFFPHNDPEDMAVSYDAFASKVVFEAPGRRSRKREEFLLSSLKEEADSLASSLGGTIFWDRPLIDERRG